MRFQDNSIFQIIHSFIIKSGIEKANSMLNTKYISRDVISMLVAGFERTILYLTSEFVPFK